MGTLASLQPVSYGQDTLHIPLKCPSVFLPSCFTAWSLSSENFGSRHPIVINICDSCVQMLTTARDEHDGLNVGVDTDIYWNIWAVSLDDDRLQVSGLPLTTYDSADTPLINFG